MMKHLITLLLALFLAAVSWSQDSEESSDTESEVAEVAEEEEDESDLDEQGFEQEDEDDFTPSQEVSADQSLAFPVDI
jgi:TATA-binding protein-associated factor Taf7